MRPSACGARLATARQSSRATVRSCWSFAAVRLHAARHAIEPASTGKTSRRIWYLRRVSPSSSVGPMVRFLRRRDFCLCCSRTRRDQATPTGFLSPSASHTPIRAGGRFHRVTFLWNAGIAVATASTGCFRTQFRGRTRGVGYGTTLFQLNSNATTRSSASPLPRLLPCPAGPI